MITEKMPYVVVGLILFMSVAMVGHCETKKKWDNVYTSSLTYWSPPEAKLIRKKGNIQGKIIEAQGDIYEYDNAWCYDLTTSSTTLIVCSPYGCNSNREQWLCLRKP